MGFLTREQILNIGFQEVGEDVLISDKASVYHPEKIRIGSRVRIDDFVIINGNLTIGNNVHVYVYSYIFGGKDGVVIEDFSGLAHGVRVFTSSDDYSGSSLTNPTVPSEYKPHKLSAPILIKKHTIIGCSSIVLPGVTLSEGTAIGAMSMVTKSTEPWSIYSGVPARKMKARKKDILKLEAEYLQAIKKD